MADARALEQQVRACLGRGVRPRGGRRGAQYAQCARAADGRQPLGRPSGSGGGRLSELTLTMVALVSAEQQQDSDHHHQQQQQQQGGGHGPPPMNLGRSPPAGQEVGRLLFCSFVSSFVPRNTRRKLTNNANLRYLQHQDGHDGEPRKRVCVQEGLELEAPPGLPPEAGGNNNNNNNEEGDGGGAVGAAAVATVSGGAAPARRKRARSPDGDVEDAGAPPSARRRVHSDASLPMAEFSSSPEHMEVDDDDDGGGGDGVSDAQRAESAEQPVSRAARFFLSVSLKSRPVCHIVPDCWCCCCCYCCLRCCHF